MNEICIKLATSIICNRNNCVHCILCMCINLLSLFLLFASTYLQFDFHTKFSNDYSVDAVIVQAKRMSRKICHNVLIDCASKISAE